MDIESYGGDPRIVATRAEIERIQAGLASVGNLLGGEVELTDFLTSPLKRIGLAMELPGMHERIRYLLQALDAASNEYFDGEALVAKELTDIGLISAPMIAAGLIGLANEAGMFREHAVKATKVERSWRTAPIGLEGLGRRLSELGGSSQILIERYGNRFIAYLPGTQTWNPVGLSNPIDFTSNLQAMKGAGLAASERGVQLALAEAIKSAGVGASASILLVGHSQGGLIAANVAQTDKRVKGLVTFGAPISQLSDKIKVPTVAIQHKNDIVPKLGLNANPLAKNLVTVERVMPISSPIAMILEAHEITNYTKTAELADKSDEFGLKRVRELVLDRFFPPSTIGVETGEATLYKLERVD